VKNHRLQSLFPILICMLASTAGADGYPRTGAQAALSTKFHNVSGTATIINSNTIRVSNFNYDGGGPAVYFYLGTNATSQAFQKGIYFTNLLTGPVYLNETVTVTLSGGQTLDGYHSISVWCRDFNVDFGSGTFPPFVESIHRNNGVTSLSVSGAAGQVYQLQGSTNQVDWIGLAETANATGTVNFADTNAQPLHLYRAEVQ